MCLVVVLDRHHKLCAFFVRFWHRLRTDNPEIRYRAKSKKLKRTRLLDILFFLGYPFFCSLHYMYKSILVCSQKVVKRCELLKENASVV